MQALSHSARRPSTARRAPRWKRCSRGRARSTTPTRGRRISIRSSSGRLRSRSGGRHHGLQCRTTSGSPYGPRSRAKCRLKAVGRPRPKGGAVPFQALLWRFPWLRPVLLLTPPMAWFVLVYLASLVLLLIPPRSGRSIRSPRRSSRCGTPTTSRRSSATRLTGSSSDARPSHGRAGPLTDVVLAFPAGYYMAKVASRRARDPDLRRCAPAALGELHRTHLLVDPDPQSQWGAELEPAVGRGLPAANIGY